MKLEKTTDLPQATDKLHLSIIEIRTHGVSSDWICSRKSNYHTITTTTDPMWLFKNGDVDYDFQ